MKEKILFIEAESLRITVAFLSMASVMLFQPEIVHAAASFGDIGETIGENAKGMALAALMLGFFAGVVFGIFGVSDFVKASRQGSQDSYYSATWKIIVAVCLLGFSAVIGSGSMTIFETDQTTGFDELGL